MELLIPLDPQGKKPLYEQIYEYLKEEIRRGNMKPEQRLPSSRLLARSLKVSRSTVQSAYDQLVAEGYLTAMPKKGYFAAKLEGLMPPVEREAGTGADREADRENSRWDVDFSPGGIDLESFPQSTWRRISREVLKGSGQEIFLKGDPQGDMPLREAIRDYLHAARGVVCGPDQIVVGAGNEYLLMLLSQLFGTGSEIAMENPTYLQAFRVLRAMGNEIYPVDMDSQGLDVRRMETLPVRAVYVMPSRQFPTGIVMPVGRRQELLSWAMREPGRFIIEDDYDSEFRYKGKPVPAMQGMDAAGRVIYMGTFSKSIAPAIRIGFLVLPPVLLERYRERAGFYSSTVSRVDQQILTAFLTGGYFERHLNRMREIYKAKHDLLLAALKPLEKSFFVTGEFAGLHVLLRCLDGRDEKELLERAAEAGIRVYGQSEFLMENRESAQNSPVQIGETAAGRPKAPATLILGYAGLKEEKIRQGAAALADVWM